MKKESIFYFLLIGTCCLFLACATTSSTSSNKDEIDQGYGKVAEKNRTTAINETDLEGEASGTTSWMELFQKTSGVTVKGSGRNLSIEIRGKKSMTAGYQPLFVVDG